MAKEYVNHPAHYNQHPAGIECIDIIRHYTCDIANAVKYLWSAGLKPEMGKQDAEKEIEDLHNALWYITDYVKMCSTLGNQHRYLGCAASVVLLKLSGHSIDDVVNGYEKNVATAMRGLLHVGIIGEHTVYAAMDWEYWIEDAQRSVLLRIDDIEKQMEGMAV